jgi:hypothetical protein
MGHTTAPSRQAPTDGGAPTMLASCVWPPAATFVSTVRGIIGDSIASIDTPRDGRIRLSVSDAPSSLSWSSSSTSEGISDTVTARLSTLDGVAMPEPGCTSDSDAHTRERTQSHSRATRHNNWESTRSAMTRATAALAAADTTAAHSNNSSSSGGGGGGKQRQTQQRTQHRQRPPPAW